MPRFFVDTPLHPHTALTLPDAVVRHLHVRRLTEGDSLTLFNGDGAEYPAVLRHVGRREAEVDITAQCTISRESPLPLFLAQGMSSGDRMEFTLQKGVEMGVSVFQPLATHRAVVKLSGDRADKRVARWQEIVQSACEQCGRNVLPVVRPILSLSAWLDSPADDTAARLMLSPTGEGRLAALPPPAAAWLLAGPEGGLTDDEETAALQRGFVPLKLGPRILRTETAALAAVAALQARFGDY